MRHFLLYFLLVCTYGSIAQLPPEFYDEVVTEEFDFPIGLTWDTEHVLYVWEKAGKVWQVDTNGVRHPEPLVDLTEEVANWRDHGLLGFALDPDFRTTGYLYLLYAVDRHYLQKFGTPAYHPDSTDTYLPSIGRVTRYTADATTDFTTLVPDSRRVLLGKTAIDGFPLIHESHSVGALVFGTDGTLLVSAGDGNSNKGPDKGGEAYDSYVNQALADGFLQPYEDTGLYRCQSLRSHSGKILRIDPATGAGLPSNPFYDAANPSSPQSRIWARGFRNPYRMVLQPETGSHDPTAGNPGTLFVGDVGGARWEELNIVSAGGQNFGWPFTEGHEWYWAFYDADDAPSDARIPNPLAGNNCPEYFNLRDLFHRPDHPFPANPCNEAVGIPEAAFPSVETLPTLAWSNSRWNQPLRATIARVINDKTLETAELGTPDAWVEGAGFGGFASMAGSFYHDGNFPADYAGKYFHLDYDNWIRVLDFDDNHQLLSVDTFHQDAYQIFFLAQHPTDGCLYFTNLRGQIRKICYGGNPLPVVRLEADTTYGPGTLAVQFDATDSYAPFGHPVTYHWDFGDGTTSTDPAPQHTFTTASAAPTSYRVVLTVTDTTGTANTATQLISLNNTPPRVRVVSFRDGDRYPMDFTHPLRLVAEVTDAEHTDGELRYEWQPILHHNSHFHREQPDTNRQTYAVISPNGCNGEDYWFRVVLTVTDPEGLATRVEQNLYPNCDGFAATPALTATVDGAGIDLAWNFPESVDWTDFELQRSADQTHFDVLQRGTPEQTTHTDATPLRGLNFYRLKYRDAAGNYGMTPVRAISFPPRAAAYLYPNPVMNELRLVLRAPTSSNVRLELFRVNGVRLVDTDWESTPGQRFEASLLTHWLERGVYTYRVTDGEVVLTGTVVRQ